MARATPPIMEANGQWAITRSQRAPNTLANERSTITRFAAYCDDMQVGHLRPEHVEGFFFDPERGIVANHRWAHLTGKPMQNSSYNKQRSNIAAFLKFCIGRGWVKTDLLANVSMERPVSRERLRYDRKQLLRLIDAANNPRDRAVLAAACTWALRASELVGLRIKHIDLESGEVRVWLPKPKRWDTMVLTRHLDGELRAWLTIYSEACGPLQPEWYLFPGKDHNRFNSQSVSVRGQWVPTRRLRKPAFIVQRAMAAAGFDVPSGEGFHTVRRSMARLAYEMWKSMDGRDDALRKTAALLHHKSVTQTEHYLGLEIDQEKRDTSMREGFLFDLPDNVAVLRAKSPFNSHD